MPPSPSLQKPGVTSAVHVCDQYVYPFRFEHPPPLPPRRALATTTTPPTSCSAIARYVSLRTFTCTSCTSTSIYVRRLIATASLMTLRLCQSNFPPPPSTPSPSSRYFSILFFSATSFERFKRILNLYLIII